jgi:D-glycero-alpha-D-manno-heptose-7-phosphate kinase
MKKTIYSRAPVRVLDIGGWTDTRIMKGNGAVFNIGINLYSNVRIKPKHKELNIISEDLNKKISIKNYRKIEYDGNLDLIKAVLMHLKIDMNADIYLSSEAPPGSGMGTSASMSVALISALSYSKGYNKSMVSSLAHSIEVDELQIESGIQDQFASAYGGLSFLEINYPSGYWSKVRIGHRRTFELENNMLLIFFNSRSSSDIHKYVIERKNSRDVKESLDMLRNCAYRMKNSIANKDLQFIGDIMNTNWHYQQKLHPSITTAEIKKVEDIVNNNGAYGFKVNGAGGGGSACVLCNPDYKAKIIKILEKKKYSTTYPFRINQNGVETYIL